MDYSIDVGNNLTTLGILFLGLKYVLPVLIGLFLLGIAVLAAYYFATKELKDININLTAFVFALLALALIVMLT